VSSAKPKDDGSFQDDIDRANEILRDLEVDSVAVDDSIQEFAKGFPLNTEISDEEREILDEIGRSERELDQLELQLRAAEDSIGTLKQRNTKFQALLRVCDALEELEALDAQDLFWGTYDADEQHARIVRAKQRIESHDRDIERAEEHRQSIVDRMQSQNLELDSLDTYLRDAMEHEERRRAEWVIEGDARDLAYREQVMPWARGEEEDQRFRLSIAATLLLCLLLGALMPMIDLPVTLRDKLNKLPERVADVIRRELPEPPAPEPVVQEETPPEEEPDPEVAEDLVDEVAEVPEDVVVEAEVEQPGSREKVKTKGILAFRDNFAKSALERPNANLGSEARFSNAGENAVGRPERSMVTTSAPGSSGGINLSDISRSVGGGGEGIEGVAITRVASAIGTGDGPDRPLASGLSAGRTDEEIQIVFDRYKAALYRLYNRELRRDPTLRGQIVLRLTIEPDGSVSLCEVQQSDMDAPSLSQQVVDRVKAFDFGAKEDIVAITIIYPIDFLPAG
jgi:outer membrane biosynthesis protein TonB/exonuclease VII small subunit